MSHAAYTTVDQYVRAQSPQTQQALEAIRAAIHKAVPGVEETISYKIPAFMLADHVVLYMGAWKNHISVYPANAEMRRVFAEELQAYDVEKSTIRFPLDEAMPLDFIARLAQFRAQGVTAPA